MTTLLIGTRLGPYELLEVAGRGGMATVYRAYQPSMDRQVAVKVIDAALARDLGSVERFQREARLIARLEHPHVLPVYDFDGNGDPQYIVMRYVAGGTLKQLLAHAEDPPTMERVLRLLDQVASALDYAHRQGIVHRDLKPSNIMVDPEGHAFLGDFGIARPIVAEGAGITRDGLVAGTPEYMSPDQALRPGEVGSAADLYSLGVMVFEICTGVLPFTGETPVVTMARHLNDPVPRASALNPGLPAAVDDVLDRALAKRPDERFGSAAELVEATAAALGMAAAPHRVAAPMAITLPRPERSAGGSGPPSSPSEQRKLVSVLCVNSAELAELVEETAGTEAARAAHDVVAACVRRRAEGLQGRVTSEAETALVAVWGAETTRENDAELAIRAALAIRDELGRTVIAGAEDEAVPVRFAVHTGPVLLAPADDGRRYTASGATVSVASRLVERSDGSVLISQDTYREVRGVFDMAPDEPMPVRGRAGRSTARLATYRVLAARARAFRVGVRGVEGVETAMVGRQAELQVLQRAFLDVIEDRASCLVTLTGGAGLGKSRILDEFDKWADLRPERCFIFRGRATPATSLVPYAFLRDLLAFRFEVPDTDAPAAVRTKIEQGMARMLRQPEADAEAAHLVGHLVGFDIGPCSHVDGLAGDPVQRSARARQLFVRFFVEVATVQPVLMELEDVHNADDASLELLGELLGAVHEVPLLAVGLARPSLLEQRPGWGEEARVHRHVRLQPLDRHDSRALVTEILQKVDEVPLALRDLLVERAEGNPLFLEELVKMLIEDRAIVKGSGDEWRVEPTRVEHLRVPQTLAGLLQARLDTLLYPEKVTLQRAAVMGRVFCDAALEAMDAADLPAARVGDLAGVLSRLVERSFVERQATSSFAGAREYRFAQSMLRDLIYESLLSRSLQGHHHALAEWLAATERADEHLPLIAEHYVKAGRAQKAARALAAAGERARGIGALEEARTFFGRALELAVGASGDAAGAGREAVSAGRLHLALGEVARLLGAYEEAHGRLATALELGRAGRDELLVAAALYQLSQLSSAQGDYPRAQELLDESLPLARAAADAGTLAQVLYGLGDLLWRAGRNDAAIPLLEESLATAQSAGAHATALHALNRLGSVAMFQRRYDAARARFEEGRTLAGATGNRERLVAFLNNLGEIERLEGRFDAARERYRETLAINREIGRRDVEVVVLGNLAAVSLRLGEAEEAEAHAVSALRLAREIGFTRMVVGSLIVFAQLRARAGRTDQALDLLGLVLAHPAADADLREYAAPVVDELRAAMAAGAADERLAAAGGSDLDDVVGALLADPPAIAPPA